MAGYVRTNLLTVSVLFSVFIIPIITLGMSLGSEGEAVRSLQQALNKSGYTVTNYGEETTYFGPGTEASLTRYQIDHAAEILRGTGILNNLGTLDPLTKLHLMGMSGMVLGATTDTFMMNLTLGMRHPDVMRLQQFLNTKGYTVASQGAGSKGLETAFYGPATMAAVKRYQEAHRAEILTPNRLAAGTGNFFSATRKHVNADATLLATAMVKPTSTVSGNVTTLAASPDGRGGGGGGSGSTGSTYTLTLTLRGSGTVSTSDGQTCSSPICALAITAKSRITLTATPNTGAAFSSWSESCSGTQTTCALSMSRNRSVTATFTTVTPEPPATYLLTTSVSGSGSVTGIGITCPTDCTESFTQGTNVTLTSTPATGYNFAGWGGACTGTATTCSLTMTAVQNVSASYTQIPIPVNGMCGSSNGQTLTSAPTTNLCTAGTASSVTGSGPWYWSCAGSNGGTTASCTAFRASDPTPTTNLLTVNAPVGGTITGTGISCPGDCTEAVASGTPVILTATPASGYTFSAWGSACTGTPGTACTLYMSGPRWASATFVATTTNPNPTPTTYTLTVSRSGTGSGSVSGTGITCGTDCSEAYTSGTNVTLTATPASGSTFTGWSGACTGTATTCTVSMTMARSVGAAFTANTTEPEPPSGASGAWSNPQTWGGSVPTANEVVTIPAGTTVELDVNPPRLAGLRILGTLRFARRDTELTAGYIYIPRNGALEVGTESAPFTNRAIITIDGARGNQTELDRGIMVHGGRLDLHGVAPSPVWTKLNSHAESAASSLTLAQSTNWRSGDTIVVAPTEWPNNSIDAAYRVTSPTERRTLASASGSSVGLTQGLSNFHFGRLQYVTNSGMSYTEGTVTRPDANTVDTLDQRAEVGNLSRNIVIQGADDDLWRTGNFGAHIMVMDINSRVRIDGAELRRMGQAGVVGRYPIHWHLISYSTSTGALIGDLQDNYIENSAIWNSKHRCVVIHATNGVRVQNNICYDVAGHAFFLEDGVERRNSFVNNLALQIRDIPAALSTQIHETNARGGTCSSASGFWLTNPDNTVTGNVGADADGSGFWLSYAAFPVKQSTRVPLVPNAINHAPFENNTAHSNGRPGLLLECGMTNDQGDVALIRYVPPNPVDLVGITSYKNGRGGYLNRVMRANYLNWAVADNIGSGFSGAIHFGNIMHSLVVGTSLNNRVPYATFNDSYPGPRYGIASYHSTMNNIENFLVNFPVESSAITMNRNTGSFGTHDYYLIPMEKGMIRNPGNVFVNADAGYRVLPDFMRSNFNPLTSSLRHALAGALLDPYGYWGRSGYWSVYDTPFFSGTGCEALNTRVPAGRPNGLSCPGPYYGVTGFQLNRGLTNPTERYVFLEALQVQRVNTSGSVLGTWSMGETYSGPASPHFKHFAALRGERYVVRFPSYPNSASTKEAPRRVEFDVMGAMNGSGDSFMVGIHFSGAVTPSRVIAGTNPDFPTYSGTGRNAQLFTAAGSLAEVESGNGSLYWQDRTNNLVWVKMIDYDFFKNPTTIDYDIPNSDIHLYEPYRVTIQ